MNFIRRYNLEPIVIVIPLFCALSFIAFLVSREYPKFAAGDCVQLNRVREDWDKNVDPVYKIARLGKEHYLFTNGHDMYFSFQNVFKKVSCP